MILNVEMYNDHIRQTIIEKEFCTITGLLASDSCTSIKKGYYSKENMPKYCEGHAVVNLDTDTDTQTEDDTELDISQDSSEPLESTTSSEETSSEEISSVEPTESVDDSGESNENNSFLDEQADS